MGDQRSFGFWLKQRRKELDLTQEKLAEQIGCAVSTIRKLEAGVLRPSQEFAERLARRLELSLEERAAFLRAARTPRRPPNVLPAVQDDDIASERPIFVARQHELAQLEMFLEQALAGRGRVVFVMGSPGSGKTMVVHEFVRRSQWKYSNLVAVFGSCNAYTGLGDPYLPFLEIVQMLTGDIAAKRVGGILAGEQARRLWALMPMTTQVMVEAGPELIDRFVSGVALLERAGDTSRGRPGWLEQLEKLIARRLAGQGTTNLQQTDLFEQYTRVLVAVAHQHPLILVVDDLQWADIGSISLLFHLARRLSGSQILLVGAYRPEEIALGRDGERHPLEPVLNELQRDFGDMWVDLDQSEGRAFVDAILDTEPNLLSEQFRETLYRHTAGHPLFTVELLKGLREQGHLITDVGGRWIESAALNWERLPARVEAVIAERIRRLPERWQVALRAASVEGEEFTAEVLARVLVLGEGEIIAHLSGELSRRYQLVRAQSVQRLGAQHLSRYRFRHFLFQKYLYDSLDPVERAHLHERVGSLLEDMYGERAADIAVMLARHFEEAGWTAKTVGYLLQAGQWALRLSAHQEALAHLTRGLALLETLPETIERIRLELTLQLAMGATLQASQGYANSETGRVYDRARDLCWQLGSAPDIAPQLIPALMGLGAFYTLRAQWRIGQELYEQIFALAEHVGDPTLLAVAHWLLGYSMVNQGAFAPAVPHLEHTIAFYDPGQHHSLAYTYGQDAGVSCLVWLTWALWCLGYPDQALQRSHEALALARKLAHPFSLAFALSITAVLHYYRRDVPATRECAAAAITLSTEHFFPFWGAIASIWHGWALAQQGEREAGLAQMRLGISAVRASGAGVGYACQAAMLAEILGEVGEIDEGLTLLDDALAFIDKSGESVFEAELHRLKGELLLLREAPHGEAEGCFREAIAVARRQQAKSWELRAIMSLCRLWQQQGKTVTARPLLHETITWFTEGFDTPDLIDAHRLLSELMNE